MELTLKRLLEQAKFTTYKGKGYESAEVDAFLDRAAAMAGKVEVQLTRAMEKANAPTGSSGPDPAAVEVEIERRVTERLAQRGGGGPSEEEFAEEARRTLILAQRTADAAIRDARADAEKLVGDAQERADAVVADAKARANAVRSDSAAAAAKERNDARRHLADEIHELERVRESLRSDTATLERHAEQQRDQLGSTVSELQQLLDDPKAFRLAPAPELTDSEIPDLWPDPRPEPAVNVVAEPQRNDPALPPEPAPADDRPNDPQPDAPSSAPSQSEDAPPWSSPAPPAPPTAEDPSPAQDDSGPQTSPSVDDRFEAVDHETPGPPMLRPVDPGPTTAPVDAVDLDLSGPSSGAEDADADDDAFLAELRKAMADDEPLGPREGVDHGEHGDLFDDDRRGWRFGRRR